jgi:hypothetical protein
MNLTIAPKHLPSFKPRIYLVVLTFKILIKMKYVLLTLSVITLFASCKTETVPPVTRESQLRGGSWRLQSGTLTMKLPSGKDTVLDYLKVAPDCAKDDLMVFDSAHLGRRLSGATTCNPSDPESVPFKWQMYENEKYIDLYNAFNTIYAMPYTVEPYVLTDAGDTVRNLKFTVVPVPPNPNVPTSSGFDINRAYISAFSGSAMTINFPVISTYLDTTNFHGGDPALPPVSRPDTFEYKLTFTK